jgi:hypothetical protein
MGNECEINNADAKLEEQNLSTQSNNEMLILISCRKRGVQSSTANVMSRLWIRDFINVLCIVIFKCFVVSIGNTEELAYMEPG